MRLIDGDAILHETFSVPISDAGHSPEWKDGVCQGIKDALRAVANTVRHAPTVAQTGNEWISVKERLPETGGEYLAGWYGSDEVVLVRFTKDCFGMEFGLCDPEKEHRPTFYYIDDEWGEVEWKDIECWMQKPVPPKEPPEVEG